MTFFFNKPQCFNFSSSTTYLLYSIFGRVLWNMPYCFIFLCPLFLVMSSLNMPQCFKFSGILSFLFSIFGRILWNMPHCFYFLVSCLSRDAFFLIYHSVFFSGTLYFLGFLKFLAESIEIYLIVFIFYYPLFPLLHLIFILFLVYILFRIHITHLFRALSLCLAASLLAYPWSPQLKYKRCSLRPLTSGSVAC